MKTVGICTFLRGGGVASSKIALAAFAICVCAADAFASYRWNGNDGAYFDKGENWYETSAQTSGDLPTGASGYFNGNGAAGSSYSASLSDNVSLYGLIFNGVNCFSALGLGGNSLTLTGASTSIDVSGNGATATFSNGTVVASGHMYVGYSNSSAGNSHLVLTDGASLSTAGWDTGTDAKSSYLGKKNAEDAGNSIKVEDGASFNTRVFYIYGTGNTLAMSNGTFSAVKFEFEGTNTLRFAGSSPRLYQTGNNGLKIGEDCTFVFDVPSAGYAANVVEFNPSANFTMPATTRLVVNAAGLSGSVTLMKFNGSRTITFPPELIAKWNENLPSGCSINFDNRTLTLTADSKHYWAGRDGADLADAGNWSHSGLPTSAAGYFGSGSEHGADYAAALSVDQTLHQFFWASSGVSTLLDLGGNTLTLNGGSDSQSAGSLNILGADNAVTVSNGTLVSTSRISVGTDGGSGLRLEVAPGATINTASYDTTAGKYTYLGSSNAGGGNAIVVGSGAAFNTRVFYIYGTGNTLSISNGCFSAVKYDFDQATSKTLHFAGANPKLYQTGSNHVIFGTGCVLSFDVPAEGWNEAPIQLNPSDAFSMPEDAVLEINGAKSCKKADGVVPLAYFQGNKEITFSSALLAKWNAMLKEEKCSVSYNSTERKLYLKLQKAGLTIIFR